MAVSPFEHPFLSGLVGDDEIAEALGIDAEVEAMLRFEAALAEAESAEGFFATESAKAIAAALASFQPDMGRLREATMRDGVVVPDLVKQMRSAIGEPHSKHLHFGATSQDVIDTALVLRIAAVIRILDKRLRRLIDALHRLRGRFGASPLMGRTRMQAAMPIAVSDRIGSWLTPLTRHRARLATMKAGLLTVQFGGAVGTLGELGDRADSVRRRLAEGLGLSDRVQWQSQRDALADFASWLSLVAGCLGKLGEDVVLLAAFGDEIALAAGGESSAMPHKRNPVAGEVLVALARFNAVQVSGMHHALIHEQERSGAAWTLEWLVLPPMMISTGAATRIADGLLESIDRLGK